MPRQTRPPAPRTSDFAAHSTPLRALTVGALWGIVCLGSGVVVVLGASLIPSAPGLAALILLAGLPLFGVGAVGLWGAMLLLRLPAPILTIGPDGLRDRRLSDTTLPWDDIDWRRVTVSVKRQSADAVQFHLRGDHRLHPTARARAALNRLFGYPPHAVPAMGLATTTDRIAAACARHKPPMDG